MIKKIMIVFLVLLTFSNMSVSAKDEKEYFKIYGDSQDSQAAYHVKNELIASFQQLVLGLDESQYHQALQDYFAEDERAAYEGHTVIVVIGDGLGSVLTGELKTDYCQSEQEIETHFFFWELFN